MGEWLYEAHIPITGSTDGELTVYQVPITITYEDGYMRSDFGDIRFFVESIECSYHLVTKTDGVSADFIVKIPTIPASPNTVILSVRCGNDDATTTSSTNNTYLFYDEGTTDNSSWYTEVDTGEGVGVSSITYSADNDDYTLTSATSKGFGYIIPFISSQDNIKITSWIKRTAISGYNYGGGLLFHYADKDNYAGHRAYKTIMASRNQIFKKVSGSLSTVTEATDFYPSLSTWYIYETKVLGINLTSSIYNSSKVLQKTINGTLSAGQVNGDYGFYAVGNYNLSLYFKKVAVSKTTTNEPIVGEIGEYNAIGLKSIIEILPITESVLSKMNIVYSQLKSVLSIKYNGIGDLKSKFCIYPIHNDQTTQLNIRGLAGSSLKTLLTISEPFSYVTYNDLTTNLTIDDTGVGVGDLTSLLVVGSDTPYDFIECYGVVVVDKWQVQEEEDYLEFLNDQITVTIGGVEI